MEVSVGMCFEWGYWAHIDLARRWRWYIAFTGRKSIRSFAMGTASEDVKIECSHIC